MFNQFRSRLGDLFADVWVLLSDTDRFISRARLMDRFESKLRYWRLELKKSAKNQDHARQIRDEIIAFRQALRRQGWELRLGYLDIQVKGFRSDDALALGFSRMILLVGENGKIYSKVGSANHIQLSEELEENIKNIPFSGPLELYYLWYRRSEGVIELAGADTQSEEAQQRLKDYVDYHKSDLLRAMIKLL